MTIKKRLEFDSLGSKKIDKNRLWGAQTQRSLENFKIGSEKIPNELIDAAKMDGMNHFQIYWYIALPIAKSVTATVAILTFLFSWNDFMGPLIYLSDQIKGTLALGLMLFVGQNQTEWGELMAISIIMILPVIIVFIAFQKYFIRGLMFGGSKN